MSTESAAPVTKRDQFKQLSVLIGLNFVDMLGFMMVLPLLPFYALKLHASAETVGWLIASFSIAQLVAAPFWGRISDRYGRRPALLIGLSGSAAAFLVFGFANALWLLFLSRIVQGLGGGTTGVAQAYVSDTVAREDRARALGWLSAATSAGVSIGPLIGSLASHLGREAPGFFAAGLCFLNALAAWRWLPETRSAEERARAKPRGPVWQNAAAVIANPGGTRERLIWLYGTGMLAFSMLTSMMGLYLNARFAVTEKTIGYFFMYNGVLALVLRSLFLGPVVDRIGEVWAMRVGTMLLCAGMLLYPLAPTVWALAVVIPLVPMGTALLFPSTTSLLSHATDPSELGSTMGVAQTFAGLARILAPLAGAYAFQRIGIGAPFIAGAVVVALVGFVAFRHVPVVNRAAASAGV